MKIDMRDKTMMMVVKMVNAGFKPTQIQDIALKHAKASLSMDYIREVAKNKYPMFGDHWEEDAEEAKRKLFTQKDQWEAKRNNALAGEKQKEVKTEDIEAVIPAVEATPQKIITRKEYQAEWQRIRRERRKSLGLCPNCKGENDNGKSECDSCLSKRNKNQRERWKKNRLRSCVIKI